MLWLQMGLADNQHVLVGYPITWPYLISTWPHKLFWTLNNTNSYWILYTHIISTSFPIFESKLINQKNWINSYNWWIRYYSPKILLVCSINLINFPIIIFITNHSVSQHHINEKINEKERKTTTYTSQNTNSFHLTLN